MSESLLMTILARRRLTQMERGHNELVNTIPNDAVKFKALKAAVREGRDSSQNGECDRILKEGISLDEPYYGTCGDDREPIPSPEEHYRRSQKKHGIPVLRWAGLTNYGHNSRPGEKQQILDILRRFFVDPTREGRTRESVSRSRADTAKVEFGLYKWGAAFELGTDFPADIDTASLPAQDYLEDYDLRTHLMCRNASRFIGVLEAKRVDQLRNIVADNAMFGMCIKSSRSQAPPIMCLARGDNTTRLELQRVVDLDKESVDMNDESADLSTWFFLATTYRIIWGLKSARENTLLDTMPMKADGSRMTTFERDEVFAEQEQQSDDLP